MPTDQDLRDALHLLAERAPTICTLPAPTGRTAGRSGRRRTHTIVAPVAAALVVAALVALVIGLSGGSAHRSAQTTDRPLSTAIVPIGLTLHYPNTWRYVPVDREAQLVGPPIAAGYLTNLATVAQCHTRSTGGETDISCGRPVHQMGPNGVFVAIGQDSATLNPPPGEPTQQVDGYPAVITRSAHPPSSCPRGSTESITALIIPRHENPPAYTLTACLTGPDLSKLEHQVHALINTAGVKPPCPKCDDGPIEHQWTARLTVGDRTYNINRAQEHNIRVMGGRPVKISLTITSPGHAPIYNVRLFLTNGRYGVNGGRLFGHVQIIARHKPTLGPNQSITASWTPTPLWRSHTVDLSGEFDIGDEGLGADFVNLQIVPRR